MDGADKALLHLGGRPLIAWVLQALALPSVAISANGDPGRFAAYGCPVLPDEDFAGQGPLAGLLAGLDWAAREGFDVLVTAPGDTPFLPAGFHGRLLPAPKAAACDGRRHHLVASWPVHCRHALHDWLSEGQPRRVEAFAKSIDMAYCDFHVQDRDDFANINVHADLIAAERRLIS